MIDCAITAIIAITMIIIYIVYDYVQFEQFAISKQCRIIKVTNDIATYRCNDGLNYER